jgi:hypothetical protein
MVWDRVKHGPAILFGQRTINLPKDRAIRDRDVLIRLDANGIADANNLRRKSS